ncbi:MAG: hypothetical protein CMH83_10925 [Nocardioides sp.]|nr:hypothetical protein [Nocardioides sp.]
MLTSRPVVRLIAVPAVALGALGWALPGVPAPTASAEVTGPDCSQVAADQDSEPASGVGDAWTAMRLDAVDRLLDDRGRARGAGVTVAVLDSGLSEQAFPDARRVTDVVDPFRDDRGIDPHGTTVAGLLAGPPVEVDGDGDDGDEGAAPRPVGIAPDVRLVDVPVYESRGTTSDSLPPTADNLAGGLEVVDRTGGVDVVLVPFAVARADDDASRRVVRAVRRLTRDGVVVVAASGDRPTEEAERTFDRFGGYVPGEDAGGALLPASLGPEEPLVVTVSSTVVDGPVAGSPVLLSSDTEVAAPTQDATSYALNGETCRVAGPSTELAAAEVAGVLALLLSVYPDPAEAVSRLLETATGTQLPQNRPAPALRDRAQGSGVVQPYAALTRVLAFTGARPDDDSGVAAEVDHARQPEPREAAAPVPQEAPDVLGSTRGAAVWWGLLGGGALALALVARPVLARRRR